MKSIETPVISHWHKLVENFEASPMEFYGELEAAIRRREIPNIGFGKIEHEEGGILAPRRVYLRVVRKKLTFDVCAAPFGKGFFFSWWLTETPPNVKALGCLALFLGVAFGIITFDSYGMQGCGYALLFLLLGTWVGLVSIREGWFLSEDAVLETPIIGKIYEFLFHPATYFKHDTALMFQDSVHAAVLEIVDGMLTTKGLRALAPEDRKPIVRLFL